MYDLDYDDNHPKVPKKRVRASQACVHCRKKKIKCDENKPDCSQCQEANVICEYTEPKKRGPRKGYVQLLEERLAQMERKLMGPNPEKVHHRSDDDQQHSPIQSYSPIQVYDNTDKCADLPPMDIVNHLVDLFFKYINSIFPLAHRSILKKSIQNGSVSRPLLYSVLAIGARFSENPSIRTNPPYLAGDRFAEKALSLVNADTLQPTLENIQFWGIMSCLEYGRASGSKSWIYGGLAIRFCQELELQREEVQSAPILGPDGSIDTSAMALRRRIYWSCYSIDKFSSAGTHRPQCINKSDGDANLPNIPECLILRDTIHHRNSEGTPITEDSLMNVTTHYLKVIDCFGQVNKYMNRAKSNSASIVWPPIAEFRNLDTQLRSWQDNLPDLFQFNENNLHYHCQHASANYLNLWLTSHATWCSSMLILHRGSLAFGDLRSTDILAEDLYRRINASVDMCRICVDTAMGVYEAIKKHCGYNTLPFLGYAAYVFSTVLMTSTFSGTPESCKKSSRGLKILSELIDGLAPYWPMCERLSNATKELLQVHQRLYQTDLNNTAQPYLSYPHDKRMNQDLNTMVTPHKSPITSRSPSSPSSSSFTMSPVPLSNQNSDTTPPLSTLLGTTTASSSDPAIMPPYQQQQLQSPYRSNSLNSTTSTNTNYIIPSTAFDNRQEDASRSNRGNEIDFNSLEFLYDTGLFGQVVFDANTMNPQGPSYYPNIQYNTSSSNTTTPVSSAFQPVIPQQQQQTFNKSLWS